MTSPYRDPQAGYSQPTGASATATAPPKRPFYKKVWFWLLVIVVLIIAIASSSSGGDGDSGGTVSDPSPSVSAPSADSPAPDPAETPAPEPEPEGPTFPGQQDADTVADGGQTITLDDVAITATPLEITQGQFGGPYSVTTVTIVNDSDEQIDFNPFSFTLQDPAGASRDGTFGCSDTMLNSGSLAPGGTVTGDVCFDATGQPGVHALIFEPLFSFNSDRAVWLTTL